MDLERNKMNRDLAQCSDAQRPYSCRRSAPTLQHHPQDLISKRLRDGPRVRHELVQVERPDLCLVKPN